MAGASTAKWARLALFRGKTAMQTKKDVLYETQTYHKTRRRLKKSQASCHLSSWETPLIATKRKQKGKTDAPHLIVDDLQSFHVLRGRVVIARASDRRTRVMLQADRVVQHSCSRRGSVLLLPLASCWELPIPHAVGLRPFRRKRGCAIGLVTLDIRNVCSDAVDTFAGRAAGGLQLWQ